MRNAGRRTLALPIRAGLLCLALLAACDGDLPLTLQAQRAPTPLADPADLDVGKLLVAKRNLGDRNFAESVILLFAYAPKNGAAGLIINRPSSVPANRALPEFGRAQRPEPVLFLGGPVSADSLFGLLLSPRPPSEGLPVLPGLAVISSRDALEAAVAEGATAERLRLYSGYAGWSPGQLEREVRRGDWYIAAGNQRWVFATDPRAVWRQLLRTVDVVAM